MLAVLLFAAFWVVVGFLVFFLGIRGGPSAALETSGEKFWRLPLGDEYVEMIKSDIGDIKNTGGRWGGAITAAEFLHTFAEDTPWIHLDIAGVAWMEENRPYIAKGPSGIAVRSILEWARSYGA